MLRAHSSHAVYSLRNGDVVVPLTTEDVAVIRILEQCRLVKLTNKKLPDVGWDLNYPSAVIQTACESLSACVEHQHLCLPVGHETLAAACLYVASLRSKTNKPGDLVYMAACLSVDPLEV
jgi:transcription initiation factor TFIIIB Brf1 subunit/transcription initiation factor TFIIB